MVNKFLIYNYPVYMFIIPISTSAISSVLPRWININNSIFPKTSSTSIVIWNDYSSHTIESTLGLPKFTKYIRGLSYIPSYHLSVLVGLLLSDAGLSKQKKIYKCQNGI